MVWWINYWPWQTDKRTADLEQECTRLRAKVSRLVIKLEVEKARSEELAMFLLEMQSWSKNNVAAVTKIGTMLGIVDEAVRTKGPNLQPEEEPQLFSEPDRKAMNGQYPMSGR